MVHWPYMGRTVTGVRARLASPNGNCFLFCSTPSASPILLKLLQKIAKELTLPDLFYEVAITLIPESDKEITHKKEKITGQYHSLTYIQKKKKNSTKI